mgnify:FL=1
MNYTLDTTALIKGSLPPRRTKKDAIFEEQARLFKIASGIIDEIFQGKHTLSIPYVALVEVAAVVSRLTGDDAAAKKTTDFVRGLATMINEESFCSEAISLAIMTKASGFDNVFIACAKITASMLITDDKKMFEAAKRAGIKARLLRDMK